MPIVYEKPDQETLTILNNVLNEIHIELLSADVKIQLLIKKKVGPEGVLLPSMRSAVAIVRVLSLKNRLLLENDAEIVIDGCFWNQATFEQKSAVIDHELTHIILVKDKDEALILDDLGRPKLKLIPDDFEPTGFYEVARRHGINSIEVASIRSIASKLEALLNPTRATETNE